MISASHNPFQDNGLKVFGRDGTKLPDEIEQRIEALILDERTRRPGRGRRRRPDRDRRAAAALHRAPRVRDPVAGERFSRAAPGCSTAPTARPSRIAPRGLPSLRRRGRDARRRSRRPEHQSRLRLAAPRPPGRRGACAAASTSGWPSTATPTAAWRSTGKGRVVDGDYILYITGRRLQRAGQPARATPWWPRS